jgi:hypothetical protein
MVWSTPGYMIGRWGWPPSRGKRADLGLDADAESILGAVEIVSALLCQERAVVDRRELRGHCLLRSVIARNLYVKGVATCKPEASPPLER